MEYGLIGKKLGHSFSKQIHERIGKYKYELVELNEDELDSFLKNKNFKAINVTIPYKEKVIEYLDFVTDEAKKIHAVNTIVNKNGLLYGYNTDYLGLKEMINHFHIDLKDKNIMILGSGGTSKTAKTLMLNSNVFDVKVVSLTKEEDTITYDMIPLFEKNIDVLINTTPKEMFPNNKEEILASIDNFTSLNAVIDVVYNPIRTNLSLKAKEKNIKYCTGLFMLVAQAFYAIEIFLEKKLDKKVIVDIYDELVSQKENIVLIGMPSSGKSSIGKMLASKMNKKFVDVDEEIKKIINMEIATYFSLYGQESFREIESEVIAKLSKENGLIIATGGGSILKKINITLLKQNGKIFFLDRALENLIVTDSRPLSSNVNDLKKLYEQRYHIYLSECDVKVDNNGTIDETINKILGG